jgi:hypothetical protein
MKEGAHMESIDGDGRIILKWILKKWCGRKCTEFIWLGIGARDKLL